MSTHPSPVRHRSGLLAGLGLAGTLVLSLALPGSASAAPVATAAADATVRAAHLSPSMPAVDIYLSSYSGRASLWLDDATYGDVSPYKLLAPGTYVFSVRKHDAAMSTAPLRTWSLTAKAGNAYTAAIVGSGADDRGVVLSDNLTPPPAGRANVRLIQASSRSGTAQVTAQDGPVIAQDAAFGTTTGYAAIKAGTWPIAATGDGQRAAASVSLRAGSVTSILLLDAPGGGTRLTSVVDAAGSATATAPKHAIDAGGGGTATHIVGLPRGADDDELLVLLVALGAAGAGLLLGASQIRRTRARDGHPARTRG